jgi:alpha-D-ribose 1-methylphosphonate 5-triphosphate synthase subunit PhnG
MLTRCAVALQGKAGYFQWREGLKAKHAATVVGLMQAAGYDEASQQRVTRFILKKDLKQDPENQVGVKCEVHCGSW